jgi:hypothetical protein
MLRGAGCELRAWGLCYCSGPAPGAAGGYTSLLCCGSSLGCLGAALSSLSGQQGLYVLKQSSTCVAGLMLLPMRQHSSLPPRQAGCTWSELAAAAYGCSPHAGCDRLARLYTHAQRTAPIGAPLQAAPRLLPPLQFTNSPSAAHHGAVAEGTSRELGVGSARNHLDGAFR